MSNELEKELHNVLVMMQDNPRSAYYDRLDCIGLEAITDLIGQGYQLRTTQSSKNQGILNIIGVPEHRFTRWFLTKDYNDQEQFNQVSGLEGIRLQHDLVYRCMDALDAVDDMIEELGPEAAVGARLAVLKEKHKMASATLNQLTNIKKASTAQDAAQHRVQKGTPPVAEIYTTEEQQKLLAKRKRDSADEGFD